MNCSFVLLFLYFLSTGLASSWILGVALYFSALGLITNASSLISLSLPAGTTLCSASFSMFGVAEITIISIKREK